MSDVETMAGELSSSARYYDAEHERLVYVGRAATVEMWDSVWTSTEDVIRDAVKPGRGTKWLVALTARYLSRDAGAILEGGCGPGHNVAALRRAGYRIIGLDYAPETVATLTRIAPELDILLGDLRRLPFANDAFAGYWSLGVIEHFYDGYHLLAAEMARVIRPQGYLFLTFPYMSPLRRLLARHRRYQPLSNTGGEPAGFYQFALNAARVAREFERFGFRKRHQTSMSGLQGFKDEIQTLHKPLQRLHDYSGGSVMVRGLRFLLEALAPLGAGHSCVMVLQKVGTEWSRGEQ